MLRNILIPIFLYFQYMANHWNYVQPIFFLNQLYNRYKQKRILNFLLHRRNTYMQYTPCKQSLKGMAARLACVRHTANVNPEPGSNSPCRIRYKQRTLIYEFDQLFTLNRELQSNFLVQGYLIKFFCLKVLSSSFLRKGWMNYPALSCVKGLGQAYLSLFSCQRTKKFAINTNKTIPTSFRVCLMGSQINFVIFYLLQGNISVKMQLCQENYYCNK